MAQRPQFNPQRAMDQNLQQRSIVLQSAQDMAQQIFSTTIASPGSTANVINVPVRNVGLVKGFLVFVTAQLNNSGASPASPTSFGVANLLSNITFTDLDNYQRINAPGFMMALLNASKEGFPQGAAILNTALQVGPNYGNNFNVIAQPATIAAAGTQTVRFAYWVPLAYSARDLRGAVYMGVVNATANLQLTINPTPIVASGDVVPAVYTGASTAGSFTSVTISVNQVYLDQLPRYTQGPNAGQPILPDMDMATQYRIQYTNLTGLTVGQDFAIPFSNFQDFMGTYVVYNRNGTLGDGTDINYFAVAAANTLQLLRLIPNEQNWFTRMRNRIDYPPGTYMFDFRNSPISTNQTGNMQLLLNPATVGAGAYAMVCFESFALTNQVIGAASLPNS